MPRPLTPLDSVRFYMPLIFMAELMMVSHSIIHAFLARLPEPKIALAAFSISFSIQTMLMSFIGVLTAVAISFVTDRNTFFSVLRFGWITTLFTTAFMLTITWSPLGDYIFGVMMGAGPEVTAQAKLASLPFSFILPVVVVRQVANGLIMINRKTILITFATAVRLAGLVGALLVTPYFFQGAAAGSAALLFCIFAESVFSASMAWPFFRELPKSDRPPLSYGEIWLFVWPVMINQFSENGIPVAINVFLGRLLKADLALAAFGVVRGLVMLLASPMRPLSQTAQTLVKTREDLRVLMWFTFRTVIVFSVIILVLFNTPIRLVILDRVMGLTPELTAYASPAMMVAFLMPVLWGFSATFRGLVTAARLTRSLAVSGAWRLAMVMAVGSVAFYYPEANGTVLGIWALMGAFGAEAIMLGRRLFASGGAKTAFPFRKEPAE